MLFRHAQWPRKSECNILPTSQFSRNALSEKSLMSKTKLISKIFHFDNPTKLTGGLNTWGRRKRQIHSRQDPVCSH